MNRVEKAVTGRNFSLTTAPYRLRRLLRKQRFELTTEEILFLLRKIDLTRLVFAGSVSSCLAGKDARPFLKYLAPVLEKHLTVLEYVTSLDPLTVCFADWLEPCNSLALQMKLTAFPLKQGLLFAIVRRGLPLHPPLLRLIRGNPKFEKLCDYYSELQS